MGDILMDALRRRRAAKRAGSRISVLLDENNVAAQSPSINFLILDDALTRVGRIGGRYQKTVELRFFAGLTSEGMAKVVGVSHPALEREWNFARPWLRRELQPGTQTSIRS